MATRLPATRLPAPRPGPKVLGQGFATLAIYSVVAKVQRAKAARARKAALARSKTKVRAKRGARGKGAPGKAGGRPAGPPGRREKLLEGVRDQTVQSGLLEGHKGWLAVGALYWGARGLRWALRPPPKQTLLTEVLQPGERLVITQVTTKALRAQAKAARRAERAGTGG